LTWDPIAKMEIEAGKKVDLGELGISKTENKEGV
jgi:hypothetical protein